MENNKNQITVAVILNPSAGTSDKANIENIKTIFSQYPGVTITVHHCAPTDNLGMVVSDSISKGADIIVAGGGDGTVSAVARALMGTTATLGILPLGTLNHLAQDLSIPLDMEAAIKVICEGATDRIDVGEVNGLFFVNNVSMGVYPKAVRFRDRYSPFIGKWPAMMIAIIIVMFKVPWFMVKLRWGTKQAWRFIPLLFIGNNKYEIYWPDAGKRTSLKSGLLWVMLLKSKGVFRNLMTILSALRGKQIENHYIEILELQEFAVYSSRGKVTLGVDGERISLRNPLWFRPHKAALQVKIPSLELNKT